MNRVRTTSRRSALTAAAVALMVGLPVTGFFLAPSAHADDSPGANLAGLNATATATGVQIAPLTPGVVGAGDVSQGNLVEAEIPYATSSTSTGPSNSAVASPVYPGDTAAEAGNALGTFSSQIPAQVDQMLNDPVVARADYPPQVSVGSSSSYSPPGGSGTGVGTASAEATNGGATSQSATSQSTLSSSLLAVGSSTASTQTALGASSVAASAHTDLGTIVIAGVVKIAGLSSDASASSDGNLGQPTSGFKLGAVTVAGVPASIGPNGITLGSNGQGGLLVPTANQALIALQQAGISVHTISPVTTVDGSSASISSGALVIAFADDHIPNPQGQVPISNLGLDVNLGMSQASADATSLPPFASFPASGLFGPVSAGSPSGPGGGTAFSASSAGSPSVSGGGVTGVSGTTGGPSGSAAPAVASPPVTAPAPTGPSGQQPAPAVLSPAATVLGAPVKVAWVVISFLLSLVAAGPLLGYANWQLLRGRKS